MRAPSHSIHRTVRRIEAAVRSGRATRAKNPDTGDGLACDA